MNTHVDLSDSGTRASKEETSSSQHASRHFWPLFLLAAWRRIEFDRSSKCVAHIESRQPACWANSVSRTIEASAEHSACFVTLNNIFMQIFSERCCLLFWRSGSSAELRAGGSFHEVSSDFFHPLPSLVCSDSAALCCCCRRLWRGRKENLTSGLGTTLDTYRTTK